MLEKNLNYADSIMEKLRGIEKSKKGANWLRLSYVFLPGLMISQPELYTLIISNEAKQ
jgi:hypothetical protein